jgi:predicted phosphodiesterase
MIIVGDVHGKLNDFYRIKQKNNEVESIIQLGDFGFKREHEWFIREMNPSKHKIIFGNHDYYPYLNKDYSLKNLSLIDNNIMTIRGAFSIDRNNRTEGYDWWSQEELNFQEQEECINLFTSSKPEIVISHDCPDIIRRLVFGIYNSSQTSNMLQKCFEIHQPTYWIFGHHHKSKYQFLDGTKFICLEELETYHLC